MNIVNELWVPFFFVQLLAIDISRHAIDLSTKEKKKKKKTLILYTNLNGSPLPFILSSP